VRAVPGGHELADLERAGARPLGCGDLGAGQRHVSVLVLLLLDQTQSEVDCAVQGAAAQQNGDHVTSGQRHTGSESLRLSACRAFVLRQ
jgi:hypothetical protein